MTPLRVIVGCEYSGEVRRAFRLRGHAAWSVDLIANEDRSPNHVQGDVFEAIARLGPWDIGIFHPECTYLTSAAEWCYHEKAAAKVKPGTLVGAARQRARDQAIEFFLRLWRSPIPKVCIENPIGCIPSRTGIGYAQIIQPNEFGHDARKATCLWLRGLPLLVPTEKVQGLQGCPSCRVKSRFVWSDRFCPSCFQVGVTRTVWANQTPSGQNALSPSEHRWKDRARTYRGIAQAMAAQWSPNLLQPEDVL